MKGGVTRVRNGSADGILYVSVNEQVSGGELSMLRIMSANSAYRCILLAPEGPLADRARSAGIEVVASRWAGRLRRVDSRLWPLYFLLRWPLGMFEVCRAVLRSGSRIVHCNSLGAAVFAALPARALGSALIWTQHLIGDSPWDVSVSRVVSRISDRVIAVSEAVRDNLAGRGIQRGKLVTIHNGLDVEGEFNPDITESRYLKRRYGLAEGSRVVSLVGMLIRRKGQEVFIDAAARTAERHADAVFLVIGEPWDREGVLFEESLKAMAAEKGIGDRVIFTGFIEEMPLAYRDIDVAVNATLVPEALCSANLEAMSMGCVCIGVRSGGTLETIDEGVDGFMLEPGDPEALADRISTVLDNLDKLDALRDAARNKVRDRFNMKTQIGKYLALYRGLAPGGGGTFRRSPSGTAGC